MPRQPTVAAPHISILGRPAEPFLSLEIAVVTPVFGGGAEPGQSAADLPIRGSAIRGQLRFWWRACIGAQLPDSPALFAREARVWGQAHRHGPADQQTQTGQAAVDLSVTVHPLDQQRFAASARGAELKAWDRQLERSSLDLSHDPTAQILHDEHVAYEPTGVWVPCARYVQGQRAPQRRWHSAYPPYVLFPFGGELTGKDARPPARGVEGVRFRLDLSLTHHATQLPPAERAAVVGEATQAARAWATFGGVGARIRRGCGSLLVLQATRCDPDQYSAPRDVTAEFAPSGSVAEWLRQPRALEPITHPRALDVPSLAGATCIVGQTPADPLTAWRWSVEWMQEFRQRPGPDPEDAREAGRGNRPGRSRWPEACSVRDAVGYPPFAHPPRHPARPYYPRADLGLPIVFHFQGESTPDAVLQPSTDGASRMASPIILAPLALSEIAAVPMALFLDAPHIWDLADVELNVGNRTQANASGRRARLDWMHDPARAAQVTPMRGGADARAAFKAFVLDEFNATEVAL